MFLSWQPAAVGIRMSALQLQLQIPQVAGAARKSQHHHPITSTGRGQHGCWGPGCSRLEAPSGNSEYA